MQGRATRTLPYEMVCDAASSMKGGYRLPEAKTQFAYKANLDVLATGANRFRWNYGTSRMCRACGDQVERTRSTS